MEIYILVILRMDVLNFTLSSERT